MANATRNRYSELVLKKLRATAVLEGLFNKSYQGDPTAGAVQIPVRDEEVAVGDYDKVNGGTLQSRETSFKTLVINQDLYVNELLDGYDAASVPGNIVADSLDSAGYSMAITVDTKLIGKILAEGGSTAYGTTTALEASTIYKSMVGAVTKAKKAHVKVSEMWFVVTPEITELLITSPEFTAASALGDAVKQNGIVGRIAGVYVYESDNIDDDSKVEFILGNRVYCHYVDEWKKDVTVEDLKDGKHIGAAATQGRRVCGYTISRPNTVFVKKHA